MQDKRYGEFDNFEDFYADLLQDLNGTDKETPAPEPRPAADRPAREQAPRRARSVQEEKPARTEPERRHPAPRPSDRRESPERPARREKPAEERPARPQRRTAESPARAPEAPAAEKTAAHPASTAGKAAAFFAALMILTVVAWAVPIRPTVSISEKRQLDPFPDFSFRTLVNGQYFRGIENWFSDTFTFRENWIGLADDFKKIYGIQTVALYGDIPVADAIPIPSAVPVESEAAPSETTTEPVATAIPASPVETSPADPEPVAVEETEGDWGGLVIQDDALIADQGAKLQIGDSIFVYPSFNQFYADKYSDKMTEIADKLEGKANFYCVLAPFNVSSMLSRNDREKYGFVIEEDALGYMYGRMGENVKKVNVLENLQKHNSEYITFRSDPHWTALGAYYAYEEWCRYAGKEPVPLSEYKEYAWEDFYGTLYYAAGKPRVITDHPDTVYAYEPPGDVHLYLDFTNRDKMGVETSLLVDRSTVKVDQYITFLSTDAAAATFYNNSIEDDSAILVLKTSFGNPFVYYLTQHYHTVYVVDMRYYQYYSVTQFVEKHHVSDVIIIHATDLCYSDSGVRTATLLLK